MRALLTGVAAILAATLLAVPCARAAWDVHDGIPIYREDLKELPPLLAADPYDAAQLGVDWLQAAVCDWMQTTAQRNDCVDGQVKTCFGCHVQAEAVLGLARSSSRCYILPGTSCGGPGDESVLEYAANFIAGAQRKACILGTPSLNCVLAGLNPVDLTTQDGQYQNLGSIGHYPPCGSNAPDASIHPIMQTVHGGLTLAGYTRFISDKYATNLVALADWLLSQQAATGEWVPDRFEAPVDQGASYATGAALISISAAIPHASAAQAAAYSAAMDRAAGWTETATHTTTQDKLFAIIALLEDGRLTADPAVQALQQDILDDQLPDGGWAERPGLQSNAYATGQALYALLETELDLDDPTVCSAVQWLLDHQMVDGSWQLGTPGVSTDSSRNSAFTATMWPVMALGSLRPFGARLSVTGDHRLTCEPYLRIPVVVSHAADSPCGLFAEPDTYDIEVQNDSGDIVSVTPSVVDLQAGGSVVVTVEWQRSGPIGPPGSLSTTTVHAFSRGSVAAGCPVEAQADVIVEVPVDTVPEAVGTGLRVARRDADLEFSWGAMPDPVGGYDLISLPCGERGACESPSRDRFEAATALLGTGPYDVSAALRGEGAQGGPDLTFYKVRARSPCAGLPGPTCNYACTSPLDCYQGCP